jgi:23S rRNA (cytidine1920-2'-O)/16S rRNA (cytidine1409-2'-O)-methyltransferase
VAQTLERDSLVVALLKPQFEIGKGKVGKGGIVRDPRARRDTVEQVRRALEAQGWLWLDEIPSPIAGQDGNIEHLIKLQRGWPVGVGSAAGSAAGSSET